MGNGNENTGAASGLASSTGPVSWSRWSPPTDGTEICAIGRVVSTHETGGSSRPFCVIVHWFNGQFGSGWFDQNNMAMEYEYGDKVYIDYWIHLPNNEKAGTANGE